jgi:protein-S-isoprenylcysteine O-methyltransferase Ste14
MEYILHLWFVTLFTLLLALRVYYHVRARTWDRGKADTESWALLLLRLFLGLPMVFAVLGYLVRPSLMDWASFPLPDSWRIAGGALATAALPVVWWVQHHLGRNFSSELRIRPDHRLVTSGPYRYVRHPMYSVMLLTFLGYLLLTANWFLAGAGLAILLLVMIFRTPREEAMLIAAFGDDYRAYMARTGRYLPRLS